MIGFLAEEPAKVATLAELVGIANAIEEEAVRQYGALAVEMDRYGEAATAAIFRELLAEEERHVDAVAHWAEDFVESVPPASEFRWRLPPELADAWSDVAGSTLLTPYRALSIAVMNEQRAFSFYAYIAANAGNPEVAHQAELLAREELAHAALLRRKRRLAYHREHPEGQRSIQPEVDTLEDFQALTHRLERGAAEVHEALARRIEAADDTVSARLLTQIALHERRAAGEATVKPATPDDDTVAEPASLLRRALEPLERMAEMYEDLAEHAPSDALLSAAQEALADAVKRLAAIGARLEQIENI